MATENSPPQIRIILTVAFSSVVILGALNSVFRSYYLMMTEEIEHDHLSAPAELVKLRAGEKANLTTSSLPIEQAMQQLASRGRTNYAAYSDQITPQASNDLGPMVGWAQRPNQALIDKITAEAANPPPAAPEGDAGTAAAADAGSVKVADAGAKLAPVPVPAPAKPNDAGAH